MSKMKVILIHLVALFEVIGPLTVWAEFSFNVTSMRGVEDVYFRMKRRRPSLRTPQEESIYEKQELCYAILDSEFFDAHNIEAVDPEDPSVHDQVKKHHPKLHRGHYHTTLSYDPQGPKFANQYQIRDVSISGNVIREFMFTCLAKRCDAHKFQQYFVSPAYEIVGSTDMVRFVFMPGEKKDVNVIAMAEESTRPKPKSRECREDKSEQSADDKGNSADDSSSW